MLLSINVIIPSLFPLMVVTCFLSGSKMLNVLPFGKYKIPIIIFILSCLGGYPIGAKIISEEYKNGTLPLRLAKKLIFCSVNSGPAFAVLTVGAGILGSKSIGLILWAAQILPNLITLSIILAKYKGTLIKSNHSVFRLTDKLVDAVSDTSAAMLPICGFITICSVIIHIVKSQIGRFAVINLLEISNAVTSVKNIYTLSFLLSFGGLAVALQIMFIAKEIKVNLLQFILYRLFIASISKIITFLSLKLFGISLETFSFSNNTLHYNTSPIAISVILLVTCICFIVSISSDNLNRKKYTDIFFNSLLTKGKFMV